MSRAPTTAFLVALLSLFSRIEAGDLRGIPAKIEIAQTSVTGRQGIIKLALVDPANLPARAKKDLQVEIQTKSEDGEVAKSTVTIKQGQTEATGSLPIKNAGIVEVTASHPELAQGGTVIDVPKSGEHEANPSPTTVPMATVAPMPSPAGPESIGRSGGGAAGNLARSLSRTTARDFSRRMAEASAARSSGSVEAPATESRGPASITPTEDVAAAATPGPTSHIPSLASAPVLKLNYHPLRKLRAEENDPAWVWAALSGGSPAATDYSVYLMSDLGPLTPEPIKIPKGKMVGEAKLVATTPGIVSVYYLYSDPPTSAPDGNLKIEFTHPVWAPKLVPQAQSVSLLDTLEVAVELVNSKDTSVPADQERPVDISIRSGTGQLSVTQVKFNPNDTRQMTKFIPSRAGKVLLVARSPYLPEQTVELTVTGPYGLLGLCGLGSLLGALLVYLTDKESATWKRLVVGFITGYVLYWAVLFGVVLIPNFPRASLLNPFTAVIVPLFGGWAGIKVMTFVAKKLGWEF